MPLPQILILMMGAGGFVALVWAALVGPSSVREGTRRLQAVRLRHSDNAEDRVEAQLRKAVAARKPQAHRIAGSESRTAALHLRLHRTGKTWTVRQYVMGSIGLGLGVAFLLYLKSGVPLLAIAVGLFVGGGLPHFVVNSLIKKRVNAFTAKFSDGIDLLVRGLRSGLPITETLGVVATEIPGPVGVEFKLITERIRIGRTMEDALQETADRLDMPEFSFFCITLAIQRETGGNLAETLANLSDVLRKRAQMKLKIRAMSSESKASAYIVGALPFIVFGLVYWTNPKYLAGFFTDDRLIVAGLCGMVWMSIGAFIMAKMVSFEI